MVDRYSLHAAQPDSVVTRIFSDGWGSVDTAEGALAIIAATRDIEQAIGMLPLLASIPDGAMPAEVIRSGIYEGMLRKLKKAGVRQTELKARFSGYSRRIVEETLERSSAHAKPDGPAAEHASLVELLTSKPRDGRAGVRLSANEVDRLVNALSA